MDRIPVAKLDQTFQVAQRLRQMQVWADEWRAANLQLAHRAAEVDRNSYMGELKLWHISGLRKRLRLQLVREPIEIDLTTITAIGYPALRQRLVEQFARLSKEDRLLWLQNFLFILTPDLRRLNDKIENIRQYRALGQQRNFLLGGPSGMGKTTYLDWYCSHYFPLVEQDRNHVPLIKVEAPTSNNSPKSLLQRIVQECGLTFVRGDNEEDLLRKLVVNFEICGVEVLMIDEVQVIKRPEYRRRVLEISNLTRGVPIICASCEPLRWVEGDAEIAGRWNDYFELRQYTGERLQQLLATIELLLPFTQDSCLPDYEIGSEAPGGEPLLGPAQIIERCTGGILRDIMILIADASRRAIENDLPGLSPAHLEATWRAIQTHPVTDFLEVLNRRQAAGS